MKEARQNGKAPTDSAAAAIKKGGYNMTEDLYAVGTITASPAQPFNTTLFDDFVKWIDRSPATTRTYLNNLQQFAAWMKYAGITAPTRDDIINYREWLQSEHRAIQLDSAAAAGWSYRTDRNMNYIVISCKPNTVVLYLRSVCQFFKWAAASGIYRDIAANIHAPRVDRGHHKKEALTAAQVLRVEQSIIDHGKEKAAAAAEARKDSGNKTQRATEQEKRLHAMYLLAVTVGLRTIELHRANVRDIETKDGQTYIYIWGKGRTEPDQKKPIPREAARILKEYLEIRADKPTGASPLFCSTGNRSKGKRIAVTTISTMLKHALQGAGINSDRITAHSLRHTAGTAAHAVTGDLYQTQQYMRHSNPATTEIYIHTETEEAEKGIAESIYNYYHAANDQSRETSTAEQITTLFTPEQLKQLLMIIKG